MTHSNLPGTIAQRRPAEQTALALLAVLALLFSMMALLNVRPVQGVTTYAVLALSEDCNQTALHKQIDWSGNDTDVIGSMHSNAGITVSGARNDVSGSVTFDDTNCNFVESGSDNTGGIDSPAHAGSVSDPGYLAPTVAQCTFTFTGSGDVDLNTVDEVWEADDVTLKTGNYCHLGTGKLQQSRQHASGTVSFFANGHIDLSNGSNANYSPFRADGVLTHSLANSVDAVTLAGSGTDDGDRTHYNGIIYAPFGEAETGGQWINIGCLVAETVKLNGSNHIIGFNCGVQPPAPVLELTKTNNTTGPVAPGTSVNFTITVDVTNGPAAGSIIKDVLPVGYDAPTAISDGGIYTPGDRTITWGPLSVTDDDTFTYTAAVSAGAANGAQLVNVAVITSPGTNCPPAAVDQVAGLETDDPCEDDSIVTVVIPPPPSVSILKANSTEGAVTPGTSVNYTLTLDVTNGPVPAMTIVDELPTGIGAATAISDGGTYDAGTNDITWNLTNVADNETLTYTAVVSASATAGTYTNTATITVGPCVEDGCDDTSDVVVVIPPPGPLAVITKTNNTTGPVAPGTAVNFTLTLDVTNGPVPAMTIVDQLPTGIGAATAISDGGTYNAGTNRITWNLTNVADNETLTYTATVSAAAASGTYTNTATITVGPCVGDGCDDTSPVVVVRSGTAGGNPSPTPAIPNTALGETGGQPVTVPIVLVVLLLVGSLGAFAVANVRSRRNRQI